MKKSLYIFACIVLFLFLTVSCSNKKTYYNVTYVTGEEEKVSKYLPGEAVDLYSPLLSDYNFIGWKYNDEIINNLIMPEFDIKIYAEFEPINYIEEAKKQISLPRETSTNLSLPKNIGKVSIEWKSYNENYLEDNGVIHQKEYDYNVTLKASFSYNNEVSEKCYMILIKKLDDTTILTNILDEFSPTFEILENQINLPTNFSTQYSHINATWLSGNLDIIDDNGKINLYPSELTKVVFTLKLQLNDSMIEKKYEVEIPKIDYKILYENIYKMLDFHIITSDIELPTEFNYGIEGTWESNKEDIISSTGKVFVIDRFYVAKLTLNLSNKENELTMSKEYDVVINKKSNHLLVNASSMHVESNDSLEFVNNELVLKKNKCEGIFESNIYETSAFTSLVGSFSAISSETGTVELLIRVRVNNNWSKYFSYTVNGWGLGLQNKAINQSDNVAKLSTDEIITQNGAADAVQFKVILRKTSSNEVGPKLKLVAVTLELQNEKGNFSIADLPKQVKYDVPRLNQNVVPSIGGVICSATSSTMLLKYKGLNFSDKDSQYEHRYVAGLVKDYGHGIYGNWSFNAFTLGAFGFRAYVKRIDSVNELINHLAYVGPVALSVKGDMVSDKKSYHTDGHLIVAIGYEIIDEEIYIICNDPNVSDVECRYSFDVIDNTWRRIAYVIE